MTTRSIGYMFCCAALLLLPDVASAQQPSSSAAAASAQAANVPAQAQRAQDETEAIVRRFGGGVDGGIAVDPELIMFGAHATFQPVFKNAIAFRPGIEFGIGELTTLFGINLDVTYTLPNSAGRWRPYVGAGPNFSLSHQGFSTTDTDHVTTPTGTGTTTVTTTGTITEDRSRFDFGDTDFTAGFNFIAGARATNGLFVEMKATAYGVSNVRLMAGFNF
jgi:hypothetical protein